MTAPTQTTITAAELRERLAGPQADQPFVLDVRTPGEIEQARIPGSVAVPLDRLLEDPRAVAGELAPCGEVAVVCRSGGRAEKAREALAGAGLTSARTLEGGMQAWARAQGETAAGPQTRVWDLERQVRFTAGSIVLASILASAVAPRAKWLAAGIGSGLVYSGVSNTCGMGAVLQRMPWNRGADLEQSLCQIRDARRA